MYSKKPFSIISACLSHNRGIGLNNRLPWRISKEIEYFRAITETPTNNNKTNAVVMGRKTWESIPKTFRPLKNRYNIVLSKSLNSIHKDVSIERSLDDALKSCSKHNIDKVFVIGGETLYKQAINRENCEKIYLTSIDLGSDIDYDATFPELPSQYRLSKYYEDINPPILAFDEISKSQAKLTFQVFDNVEFRNKGEQQYLNALRNILEEGHPINDRTGVGTIAYFGTTMRFDLSEDRIPLLTTKKMFLRGIVEELLFFLRGDIDNKKLREKKVRIWNGNTTRDFLDKIGLCHIETDSLGKAYGFQWRNWGAPYLGVDTDYDTLRKKCNSSVTPTNRKKNWKQFVENNDIDERFRSELKTPIIYDQIADVLDKLKNNQNSRRIVLNAWNVSDLTEMCLPPCHVLYIFTVIDRKLSCQLTTRSGDFFLGVPFNIVSAALLTKILAKAANLDCGSLKVDTANAHIYNNHIDQVRTQLDRLTYTFPRLKINKEIDTLSDIENLQYSDFKLYDYHHHPTIKAPMAV
jgi:dihydrofolate reductase/thymidylate synthase